MIAEAKFLHKEISIEGGVNALIDCLGSKNTGVRKSVAEPLSLLFKTAHCRKNLRDAERISLLLNIFKKQKDSETLHYIMLCFVNLSLTKTIQKMILHDDELIDDIINYVCVKETPDMIQYHDYYRKQLGYKIMLNTYGND